MIDLLRLLFGGIQTLRSVLAAFGRHSFDAELYDPETDWDDA